MKRIRRGTGRIIMKAVELRSCGNRVNFRSEPVLNGKLAVVFMFVAGRILLQS